MRAIRSTTAAVAYADTAADDTAVASVAVTFCGNGSLGANGGWSRGSASAGAVYVIVV